jgi:hypothetical protein
MASKSRTSSSGLDFLRLAMVPPDVFVAFALFWRKRLLGQQLPAQRMRSGPEEGSMPFCVELDNIKDTGVPIHPPAVSPVAAG